MPKHIFFSSLLLLISLSFAARAEVGLREALPETTFAGWRHAILLTNAAIEIVVVPEAGRIMSIRLTGQENVLRVDPDLAGTSADVASREWDNFGGAWLWPVAQSHWEALQGNDWPPSPLLDGRPWTVTAWRDVAGVHCEMRQSYGPPLNILVTRHISLQELDAEISIVQRIVALDQGSVPVSLWSISQIAAADAAVFPVDSPFSVSAGYRTMGFDQPSSNTIVQFERCAVFLPDEGSIHKFCTESGRAWVAARKGNTLIVERAIDRQRRGHYPDDGCSVEVFSSKALGYTEIETLSKERTLSKGERVENELRIACYPIDSQLGPRALADVVLSCVGE